MSKIVFYVRNRPQGCDAQRIAVANKRSFIGYPAWRAGKENSDRDFKDAIVDLLCPDDTWQEQFDAIAMKAWQRQISGNRNLVRDAIAGSITLMPRPLLGVVFAGRVERFELTNNPDWGEAYLSLRREQKLPDEPRGKPLG